jgi:hypothetical protein
MVTVVTAFFDLQKREGSSRRAVAFYQEHGRTLCERDVSMIIFSDPELCETILQMRTAAGHKEKTLLVPLEFENIPYHQYKAKIVENRAKNPIAMLNPIKDTINYQILNWAKPWFIAQASERDPFNSTHYIWNDFGLAYVVKMNHADEDAVYTDKPEKIRYMENRVLNPELVSEDRKSVV